MCCLELNRGEVAVELVAVDDHYGTADMLRAVKDRIKGVRSLIDRSIVSGMGGGARGRGVGFGPLVVGGSREGMASPPTKQAAITTTRHAATSRTSWC